jgi:hypothetical protein
MTTYSTPEGLPIMINDKECQTLGGIEWLESQGVELNERGQALKQRLMQRACRVSTRGILAEEVVPAAL